jgi:two-component system chemotaxis response regulator CheY
MPTVLLVDDARTILMTVGMMLTRHGFTVVTAGDGREALDLLATTTPDLIITDLNMPRMDGLTLVKEVRRLPRFGATPILLLTTENRQERRDEAKVAGATGWLHKPLTTESLLAVVDRVLPRV